MCPLPHHFGSAGDDMENIIEEHTTGGPSTMGEKRRTSVWRTGLLKMADRDVRVGWHNTKRGRDTERGYVETVIEHCLH